MPRLAPLASTHGATGRSATTTDDAPPTSSAPSARPTTARWRGTPRRRPTSPTSTTRTACWCGSRTSRSSTGRVGAGSMRASSRTGRGATTCASSTASWCATSCPSAPDGQSVGDVLDLLEESGLRRGAASPDHWVHVSPAGAAAARARPSSREETGLTEPWPPEAPQGKGSEVSVVVVDTGWHPPAATDPRTPWLKGVDGDDELNGPDLRPYAGHGTFIAGVVRCIAPVTRVYVEGFAIGGVGGGGILESDLVVQLEEALDARPAGHQPVGRLPHPPRPALDRARDLLPHPAAQARLRPRGRGRQRLLVRAVLARGLRLGGRRRLARPRRPGVGLLQLRRVRRRLRPRPQPGQRLPRRHLRVPRDAGQGRHPGLQHRPGTVERHVLLRPGRRRADRPGDLRDGRVRPADARRRRPRRADYDSDPMVGPLHELRQPYA